MISAPASAAESENLQLFRDVQRQVLQYPHFTIFDSVHANVDSGHVTLVGKVTMPYKRTDIENRVAKVAAVTGIDNKIEVLPVSQFDNELRFSIARAIYSNHNFRPYASMVNRRARSRHSRRRREQPGGPDAGAVDCQQLPLVRREERVADRGRGQGRPREAVSHACEFRAGAMSSRPCRATRQITIPNTAAAKTIVEPNNNSVE